MLHKVKAFTIMELIIAMMLTTLIVGITFYSMRLVEGNASKLTANFKQNQAFIRLRTALKKDAEQASHILSTSNGFLCQQDHQLVRYALDGQALYRTVDDRYDRQLLDSFDLPVTELILSFQNSELINEDQLIDLIQCGVQAQNSTITISIVKTYDSVTLTDY